MRIADGVEMLELSTAVSGRPGTINPTLIWDDTSVTLVDTGLPGMLPQIQEAMEKADVPFTRLDQIIITHHDIDHIGCLASIRRELGARVRVLSSQDEIPYISGEKRPLKLAQFEENLAGLPDDRRAIYERMKSGFGSSFAPVDQGLADGEALPVAGGLVAIHTPGHTIGHMCLYLQRSQLVIAGDALRVQDGKLIQTPAGLNFDLLSYRQSLEKLAGFQIDTIISYHGGLYRGPASQEIAQLAAQGG
jgi:glyoxylase-like metal-dependent hydrolase (beta-lactamase superfamily II)